MTVRELLERLNSLNPDARVLLPAADHSYRDAAVQVGTALYSRRLGWTEDFGEEDTPESEYGRRLDVVIIA